MVSKELVLELQKIAKEEQNKDFSFEEASEVAENLVGFFDLLLKIDSRNNKDKKVNDCLKDKAFIYESSSNRIH